MSDPNDRYDLRRFVDAQNSCFESVCSELQDGVKKGHWIWFIFPQIQGLGHSPTAQRFAISSREAAEAYLGHPILGCQRRRENAPAGRSKIASLMDGRGGRGCADSFKQHHPELSFPVRSNEPAFPSRPGNSWPRRAA